MFANMLPDILERLGPDGAMTLRVQRRLVPLFQRSFPEVEVTAHRTVAFEGRIFRTAGEVENWDRFDYWAAIGDFPAQPARLGRRLPEENELPEARSHARLLTGRPS
ncbi:hypothetical protein ACRAWD_15710 [Caulobacter segnis]